MAHLHSHDSWVDGSGSFENQDPLKQNSAWAPPSLSLLSTWSERVVGASHLHPDQRFNPCASQL
eukprot:scaffold85538_cov54-Attheya_sp.AAC.3